MARTWDGLHPSVCVLSGMLRGCGGLWNYGSGAKWTNHEMHEMDESQDAVCFEEECFGSGWMEPPGH